MYLGLGLRLGSGTVAALKPTNISELDLWLDAADGNTLFDATSGGNLVSTNGSAVKRWEDKSGNSKHAIEATNPPTLSVAEKNGFNALNFATNKFLTCSFSSKTFTAQTVFVVFKYSSSADAFARAFTQSITNDSDFSISGHHIPIIRANLANEIGTFTGSAVRSTVSTSNNIWYVARIRHTGSAVTMKLNSTEGASFSNTLNRGFENYRIGAAYTAPAGGAAAYWNSLFSEVIVYSKSLTDAESNLVTNYLNSKWAIF